MLASYLKCLRNRMNIIDSGTVVLNKVFMTCKRPQFCKITTNYNDIK